MKREPNPAVLEYIVPPTENGQRLDSFIAAAANGLSRSYAAQLIEQGHILLNGKPSAKNRRVKENDRVSVEIPPPVPVEAKPEELPLEVLYEDDCLAVINKQRGMVVHLGHGHPAGTLVNALLFRFPLSSINGEQRPGIVHRLDKDTTGAMVIAKTDAAHRSLSQQFKERTCEKRYWALCEGVFNPREGRVENMLGRDPRNRQRMAAVSGGKRAVTEYKVLEQFPSLALVECLLVTGRTHQIRVHMKSLGHPCYADTLYGRSGDLAGQALHARQLCFIHPQTGERLCFTAPLPEDFAALLENLRRSFTQFKTATPESEG